MWTNTDASRKWTPFVIRHCDMVQAIYKPYIFKRIPLFMLLYLGPRIALYYRNEKVGDAVALCRLAGWTPDRKARVRALAGSLCCVLGHNTLLSQCLSPPRSINVYQETFRKCWGVIRDGLTSHPGGVAILLVASCYGKRDKLRRCGPLVGSCARFSFTFI